MPTLINAYGHPEGESWDAIQQATKTFNGLQTQFVLKLCEDRNRLPPNAKAASLEEITTRIEDLRPKVCGLFFYEGSSDSKVVIHERLPDRIYVSCNVSKKLKDPPFRLYLLYQMAAAAITLAARLNPETNDEMIHKPPIGCLWDWWTSSAERSAAMVAARICQACQSALRSHGNISAEAIIACQQVLDYIRRIMMGESPEMANRVFIAYGHGNDWMGLRDLLQSWGLQVEHFNREPVAGLLVAERWRQMLNRARFAFAVMTPDDEMKNGTKQARQNVIHEIGLCHARVGLHNTAILLARGTEKFSNVDGINYISFEAGNLGARSNEIRRLLEDRGIL
jgi:hypothetical protein